MADQSPIPIVGAPQLAQVAVYDKHFPPMPADYWPEIKVVGEEGETKLGFALIPEWRKNLGTMKQFIDALRHSIWVREHWTKDPS